MFHGSLVALVTPFDPRGDVDYPAFDRLLEWHADAGTDGIVVGGTTGESATLTLVERVRLVERAVEQIGDRMVVLAGAGTNNTADSLNIGAAVTAAGASACLVVTPYYNRPTQRGLEAHFLRLADKLDTKLMMYNVPSRTGVDLKPATVARLARHPNIVAIKEATGSTSRIEHVLAEAGDQLAVLSGDDVTFVDSLAVGAAGVVSVTANVAPDAMAAICAAARRRDFRAASALNAPLEALHQALLLGSNPMATKLVLSTRGLCGRTLRLPLVPLEAEHHGPVFEACRVAGIAIDELVGA